MGIQRIGLLIVTLTAVGCGGDYSPGQAHQSVKQHPNNEGVYLAYYRWNKMIDGYGPGLAKVLEAIKQSDDDKVKLAIWDKTIAAAVSKYLEERNLVPSECTRGVSIVSSNKDEAGGGVTAFRCR